MLLQNEMKKTYSDEKSDNFFENQTGDGYF